MRASQDHLEASTLVDTSSIGNQITSLYVPATGETPCSAASRQPQLESEAEPSRPRRKRNKEVNRRAQKNYRERNKVHSPTVVRLGSQVAMQRESCTCYLQNQLNTLKSELAQANQALALVQSRNEQQAKSLSMLRAQACSGFSLKSRINWQVQSSLDFATRHLAPVYRTISTRYHCRTLICVEHVQGTDELDHDILCNVMPVWRSGTAYTCTVTPEQADAMQRVSRASPQQLAILWQVCHQCSCYTHLCLLVVT